LKNKTVCEGSAGEIEVVGNQISWFSDALLTNKAASGNLFYPVAGKSDTTYYAAQQDGEIFGPSIQVVMKVDKAITGKIIQSSDSLSAPDATTYQWIRNDSVLTGFVSKKIKATIPGVYRIRATRGTCSVDSISFIVKPSAPQPSVKNTICINDTLTVDAKGNELLWYNAQNAVVATSKSYEHKVVSTSDTAIWVSQTVNMIEGPKALATWNVFEYPEATLVLEGTVLHASAAQQYQWFNDGVLLQGKIFQELDIVSSGVYHCRASNGECATTTNSMLLILTPTEQEHGKTFNHRVQGKNLLIHLNNNEPAEEVVIFDVNGSIVSKTTKPLHDGDGYSVDVSALRPGLYIFVVNALVTYKGKFIRID
jgi:hypothetical protein